MNATSRLFKAIAICLFFAGAVRGYSADNVGDWAALFTNPPDAAKPWVYWWWLDSNVTKEGITKDLEEMKRQGVAGALVFDAGEGHTSPVGPLFMGPEWLALFKHAVIEADRIGLQLSLNICSGWDAGGTWVTLEHAIKGLTWSRTLVRGPIRYAKELPKPPVTDNYYKDVCALAYRMPHDTIARMEQASVKMTASSWYRDFAPGRAVDLDDSSRWISNGDQPGMGPSETKPEFLQFDFSEPFPADGIYVNPYSECGPRDCQVQASQDGVTFQTVCRFMVEEQKPATIAFDEVSAKSFRLLTTSSYPYRGKEDWNVQVCEVQLLAKGEAPQKPVPNGLDIRSAVDLSQRMDNSGRLAWDVPAGTWCIFRAGETIHGKYEYLRKTKCVSRGAQGYEIDCYSRAAMDMQFAETAGKAPAEAGELAGKTLAYFHDDSWECDEPNWTPRMREEFARRRGYDPSIYLPALTGRTVGDRELSARFMRDFRRTTADLMAENHYGRFEELSRRAGMGIHSEAGGPFYVATMDPLMNLCRDDIPMGEYWIRRSEPDGSIWFVDQYAKCDPVKQAATAAHIYGKKLCQAEAFTNMGRNREEAPSMLKDVADRAFCAGPTRNMLCFYVHQPYLDIKPGYEWPKAGTHFDRNITWWDQMHAFTAYLSRCQLLLQQGLFVADVCYFAGD